MVQNDHDLVRYRYYYIVVLADLHFPSKDLDWDDTPRAPKDHAMFDHLVVFPFVRHMTKRGVDRPDEAQGITDSHQNYQVMITN